MTRTEIKARARNQLENYIFSNNWMMAVLVVLIFELLKYIVNGIPGIGSVIALVVAGPLSYGVSYLFLKQARDGQQMNIAELFNGFEQDFGQLFLLNLMQVIFIALWSCLLVIPGIVKAYSYSMSYFIKVDHPEYSWKECIDESKKMMNGHKAELFVLDLSFLGWFIVGAICLGVGTLWVSAYVNAAHANFYESIKRNNLYY